jgi:dihydrofolate reductase
MSSTHQSTGGDLIRNTAQPVISLIWAMARNRVIGDANALPWKLPADMRWFRRHTLGKPVIMGRKTFESFGAKPLPDRSNIVISRNPHYSAPGALVVTSLNAAIDAASTCEEIMIIGGASLYEQALPLAQRLYMTEVLADIEGDAHFPRYDSNNWREILREQHNADDKNRYDCVFVILEKI